MRGWVVVKFWFVVCIVCYVYQCWVKVYMDCCFMIEFVVGELVCVMVLIWNDGMYLYKDIGEVFVYFGDIGVVCESWWFFGEVYYIVEFLV